MHRARAFFYVCAGLFLLALSYHLGARSATAQATSQVVGFLADGSWYSVLTPNGDIYQRRYSGQGAGGMYPELIYGGNFWSGPTPTQRESFGALKSRYRGERGAAQPMTQGK